MSKYSRAARSPRSCAFFTRKTETKGLRAEGAHFESRPDPRRGLEVMLAARRRLVNTTLTPAANPLISFSLTKAPRAARYSASSQPSG
jgi:hypothetical protein